MEKSCFFNSVDKDRLYDAEVLAGYFATFIDNGVFYKSGTDLAVNSSVNNDMTVNIQAGKAFINGYLYENDDILTLTLPNSSGTLNRIDRIIIRLDLSARQIAAKVISSMYSLNPTPPEITRNAQYHDLVIAEVFVPAGATSTSTKYITDKRINKDLCGFVTAMGQKIDTTELEELVEKWYANYEVLEKKISDATLIKAYTADDTSNNIKITAEGVTPKTGDIIAVRMTNPNNDDGIQPGATLTFNGDAKPIKCLDGQWTVRPIAQYATVFFAYANGYWTMLTFDGGMISKTIAFPSGGNVTPENGTSLDVGTATSDVTVLSTQSGNIQITASIIFKKGSATKITVAPYYYTSKNVFDLSEYTANDYVIISINNGAVSIGKSI